MKKTPIEEICETLTSNIETYFTTYSSEDYYYITYKGTPVAPKGKIKTFKNPSKARAYINSEITWNLKLAVYKLCLLYTSPSPRDRTRSRMPSSA